MNRYTKQRLWLRSGPLPVLQGGLRPYVPHPMADEADFLTQLLDGALRTGAYSVTFPLAGTLFPWVLLVLALCCAVHAYGFALAKLFAMIVVIAGVLPRAFCCRC